MVRVLLVREEGELLRLDRIGGEVPGTKFPCGVCAQPAPVYDHTEEQLWRHLDTCQCQTYVHARLPRTTCPTDGVRQVSAPWAEPRSQFTRGFECRMIDTLRECDVTLSGFRSDATLELYFNIARGQQSMGYIAKGWGDPGFRIGDLIMVTQSKALTLIANAFQVMKLCATNGIGISVQETADSIELALDGVIYSEGFNRNTFVKTLDTLNECVKKVRVLVGVG